jgi:hypothetical protein
MNDQVLAKPKEFTAGDTQAAKAGLDFKSCAPQEECAQKVPLRLNW